MFKFKKIDKGNRGKGAYFKNAGLKGKGATEEIQWRTEMHYYSEGRFFASLISLLHDKVQH